MDLLESESRTEALKSIVGGHCHGDPDQSFYLFFEAAVEDGTNDPPEEHEEAAGEATHDRCAAFGTALSAFHHEGSGTLFFSSLILNILFYSPSPDMKHYLLRLVGNFFP